MRGPAVFTTIWLAAAALLGCAGAPPPDTRPWSVQAAERLERTLSPERAALAPQQAVEDLERALQYYALADDQAGQARCHLKLARLYLRQGMGERVGAHVADAAHIAARLGDGRLRFESALLAARASGRSPDYERALSYAAAPLERATVLTYLGRTDEAYTAIRAQLDHAEEAPEDYAFVLYRYAAVRRDPAAADRALALYKQADNHAGTAAALELLGTVSRERGEPAAARAYLERALAVSRALGEPERIVRIEAALAGL